jgi:aspartyl-tRNA(Asn)/glutamyl-tRNA(Gln) amidotransferase subunit A
VTAPVAPGDEVAWLPAVALCERFARRELSPVEVVDALLARIEALDPHLRAFITVTPDVALAAARAAEAAYRDGDAGPLAGVPLTIKDTVPTAGIRTTAGSLLHRDEVPDADAPIAERLRGAGAALLGKTTTPEYGWKAASANLLVGPSRNPWRADRTTGGSSAGAAAAVAAGIGPLAQGGDGAGSIRIPAAFCGIFGLKTSAGLVPLPPATDTAAYGPLVRTVRDAARFVDVVAGEDARDRWSWGREASYEDALADGIAGVRIAWSPSLGGQPVERDVAAAVESAAERFASDLGAHVEPADPPVGDLWPALDVRWCATQAAAHPGDELDRVRDLIDPGRLPLIERGRRLTAVELVQANAEVDAAYERMRAFMERFDLLLTPTVPIGAFAAELDQPGAVCGRPTEYLSWTPFTYPFNLSGQPAATVPCGRTRDGLPVGLQIVGGGRADALVLRAAAAFERAAPWAHERPPLGADME